MENKKYLSVQLRSLSNMIMRYMDANSHKDYVDSITGTNGWIIGYIEEHSDRDVFQRDLEKAFGITRSTASKVVDLMVRKGLIERVSVDYDARLKKLVLTEKSKELTEYMHKDIEMMERTLTAGFSEEDKEKFIGYISRMKDNLKGVSDECPKLPRKKG